MRRIIMLSTYKKYIIIGLVLILFVIFYGFSREVNRGFLKQTDFAVTVKIQEKIDKSSKLRLVELVGNIMEGSTFLASPEFSVISIVFLFFLSLYNWKQKKFNLLSLSIPICFALLIAGEVYGKTVVHHPAPPFFMIKNPTTIFPKYYINESFSYPSGHVARSIFISVVVYLIFALQYTVVFGRFRKFALLIVLVAYIFLVSVSRIYLGHHWLSDVFGGALLGLGFGLLTLAVNSLIIDRQ